jgi:hypothetical protein
VLCLRQLPALAREFMNHASNPVVLVTIGALA